MLKRLLLVLLLTGITLPAFATDYSDMWYLPAESGWGVNFTQNENVIFITFFLYGLDGKPTWYVAIAYQNADGSYSGSLYSTVGTYFGATWGGDIATLAGTASFVPVNAYQGTLKYTLIGGPAVNKTIVRQTLTTILLAGNYTGGQSGAYSGSGCALGPYVDTFDLQVSQSLSTLTLTFNYFSLGASCTLSGAWVQDGQLVSVPFASYVCGDGLNTTASLSEIKKTSLSIEGKIASSNVGGGCREDASFSGVNLQ